AAIGPDRQSATDNFPQSRDIRLNPVKLLRATISDTETGHDLVKDEHCFFALSNGAEVREILTRGRHDTHVSNHRLHNYARNQMAILAERLFQNLSVIERQRDSELADFFEYTRRPRNAESGNARSRFDHQGIGMAV